MINPNLIYRTAAAKILKLSLSNFDKLKLQPHSIVRNPHRKTGGAKLYRKDIIFALVGTDAVEALQPKKRPVKNWKGIFAKQYMDDDSAIAAALDAVWKLENFEISGTCKAPTLAEVKELRKEFWRVLYAADFAKQVVPILSDPSNTDSFEIILFRFQVGELSHIERIEREDINFDIVPTGYTDEDINFDYRPLYLNNAKSKEYRELIKYATDLIKREYL